jgi:hypothetical protein
MGTTIGGMSQESIVCTFAFGPHSQARASFPAACIRGKRGVAADLSNGDRPIFIFIDPYRKIAWINFGLE